MEYTKSILIACIRQMVKSENMIASSLLIKKMDIKEIINMASKRTVHIINILVLTDTVYLKIKNKNGNYWIIRIKCNASENHDNYQFEHSKFSDCY